MSFSKSKPIDIMVRRQLKQVIKYATKEAKLPLDKIYLFGSCARGTARDTSDIDIAFLSDKPLPLLNRRGIGRVSVHIYSPSILESPQFPIHSVIQREGIPLSALSL